LISPLRSVSWKTKRASIVNAEHRKHSCKLRRAA
jgi:hypothetical protein